MPLKVYIDSRFRKDTGGNNSDSEFTVELPHPIQVKGRACVDVVLVPNTFYVIRTGENDRLHVRENASTYRVCTIAEGQYSAINLKMHYHFKRVSRFTIKYARFRTTDSLQSSVFNH